ncbi:MAG: hypothetical protein Tsb0016_26510 [Sphingomonadales bacterium]
MAWRSRWNLAASGAGAAGVAAGAMAARSLPAMPQAANAQAAIVNIIKRQARDITVPLFCKTDSPLAESR